MEFFYKAKAVRLQSHIGKYLLADEDYTTVRQSHIQDQMLRKVIWKVEFVEGNNHLIRLKSFNDNYLTATEDPFLFGVTGKKVIQTPLGAANLIFEWEPITEGSKVKLRTRCGTFLRGNGATKPWRNSVTHDFPERKETQDWVLWDVIQVADSMATQIGMEFFSNARVVRLKSHLDKYLVAEDNDDNVTQTRDGSSNGARWTVELTQDEDRSFIRLKSCFGKYLTASNSPLFLGATGRKVLQTLATTLDSSTEWEPSKEDNDHFKLKTSQENFLRANGGVYPYRNSVTHDVPVRTDTKDWVLWKVEVLESQSLNW